MQEGGGEGGGGKGSVAGTGDDGAGCGVQEDSIIFSLIERAQFRQNRAIYMKGLLQVDDPSTEPDVDFLQGLSFLEYVLLETEKVHSKGEEDRIDPEADHAVWRPPLSLPP